MAEEVVAKSAEPEGTVKTWKRRGLLAAAWATVAAIVAKQTTQPVDAGVDGDVVLGAFNTTSGNTAIINTSDGGGGWGLFAKSSSIGLYGDQSGGGPNTTGGAGVLGSSNHADGHGVLAINDTGLALLALTSAGPAAVRGEVNLGSFSNSIAIYGANNSRYEGSVPGAGGFGVYGLSAYGHGLVGATATAGGAAMVGATNGVAGAYAGLFYGPVIVTGSFAVVGTKSAAVPHPDGSHRLMYCMESPESWFEDFGKGQLQCGQADVTIDPNFAAVANMEDYHVFVTEYGRNNAVCVTEQTPTGFRVQASQAGVGEGTFSWRVVAKRKDIVGERLARVTTPPEPQLPTAPPLHEPPAPPDIRARMVR